ncbi:MAG: hypothetical protein M3Q63_02880 [bacterium]|nr:hypothetical protein [bacterium]
MESDILKKLEEQQIQINNIFKSVEKTRKYFLWTFIITIALFILPLIGVIIVLPTFISTYTETLNSLGL